MSKSTPRYRKDIVVKYVQRGRPQQVIVSVPETGDADEQQRESEQFVQTLADNDQLEGPDASHEIVKDASGADRLKRRGFSRR